VGRPPLLDTAPSHLAPCCFPPPHTVPLASPAPPGPGPPGPAPQSGPLATYVDYRRAREAALPLGPAPALEAACGHLLPALVGGRRWPAYKAAGFDANPELLQVAATDFDEVPYGKLSVNSFAPSSEVGDPSPVAAWAPDYDAAARPGPARGGVALETASVTVLRAQYEAFHWMMRNQKLFPVIKDGP
jgi:hypothetical protein